MLYSLVLNLKKRIKTVMNNINVLKTRYRSPLVALSSLMICAITVLAQQEITLEATYKQ